WGLSTVVASRSTKILGSQQALAWVMLMGFGVTIAAAPFAGWPRDVSAAGLGWALAAGLGSMLGLSMMYRALRIGKVGVGAPVAAAARARALDGGVLRARGADRVRRVHRRLALRRGDSGGAGVPVRRGRRRRQLRRVRRAARVPPARGRGGHPGRGRGALAA